MKLPMVCTAAVVSLLALSPISSHAQRPGGTDDSIRPARRGTDDDSLRPFRRLAERVTFDRRAAVVQVVDGVQVRVSPRVGLDKVSPDELDAGVVLAEYEVTGSGKASEPASAWKAVLPDGRHRLVARRDGGDLRALFLMDGKTAVAASVGKLHLAAQKDEPSVKLALDSVAKRGARARKQKVVTRTCFRILGINVFCVERTRTISGDGEEDEEW